MIYSIDYVSMTEELNPFSVVQYLDNTGWKEFPVKKPYIKVFQWITGNVFEQVTVPMNKELKDYRQSMYATVESISRVEKKSFEEVMLFLLNPNADILKIRVVSKSIETGNIRFDDAINLYENAKKLLGATVADIITPKKMHYGRNGDTVQRFLNECRFGQTEIGSYVVSVICPFAKVTDRNEYEQLSIFSEEEQCADSLTRQVVNRLMNNLSIIKSGIDAGKIEYLLDENYVISTNFYEALNGISLYEEGAQVEFFAKWSPVVKKNRFEQSKIKLTSDYYQPINAIINEMKGYSDQRTELVGKIKQLKAAPILDKREYGTVSLVYISDDNKARMATVKLNKDDYNDAVEAHRMGKTVRVIGDLKVSDRSKVVENAAFSVVD